MTKFQSVIDLLAKVSIGLSVATGAIEAATAENAVSGEIHAIAASLLVLFNAINAGLLAAKEETSS